MAAVWDTGLTDLTLPLLIWLINQQPDTSEDAETQIFNHVLPNLTGAMDPKRQIHKKDHGIKEMDHGIIEMEPDQEDLQWVAHLIVVVPITVEEVHHVVRQLGIPEILTQHTEAEDVADLEVEDVVDHHVAIQLTVYQDLHPQMKVVEFQEEIP